MSRAPKRSPHPNGAAILEALANLVDGTRLTWSLAVRARGSSMRMKRRMKTTEQRKGGSHDEAVPPGGLQIEETKGLRSIGQEVVVDEEPHLRREVHVEMPLECCYLLARRRVIREKPAAGEPRGHRRTSR